MDTVSLLVELATSAHHQINLDDLLISQPSYVKQAYAENDAAMLKHHLSNTDYLANESHVVQIKG